MTEPIDQSTKERIEKDATTVLELTKGFTPEQRKEMGNMLTSLEEMAGNVQILCQKLKQERALIKELVEYLEQYKFIFDEGGQTRKEIESLIQKAKDKSHE